MLTYKRSVGRLSKVLILHYELFASSLKKEKLHGTTSDQEEEGVSLATLSRIMAKKYDRYNISRLVARGVN